MSAPNINPRVVQWARVTGADVEKVMASTYDDQYRIGKTPWTVLFTGWTNARWAEYHELYHGKGSHHDCLECLSVASTSGGEFDKWLESLPADES